MKYPLSTLVCMILFISAIFAGPHPSDEEFNRMINNLYTGSPYTSPENPIDPVAFREGVIELYNYLTTSSSNVTKTSPDPDNLYPDPEVAIMNAHIHSNF